MYQFLTPVDQLIFPFLLFYQFLVSSEKIELEMKTDSRCRSCAFSFRFKEAPLETFNKDQSLFAFCKIELGFTAIVFSFL